jgi:hypothetical protein
LTGQEGKLFTLSPSRRRLRSCGTVIAVTLSPCCALALGGRFHSEDDNPVMRVLHGSSSVPHTH